jgi:plasmid stabilization system protein ParE
LPTSHRFWITSRTARLRVAERIHARIRAVIDLLLQYPLAGVATDDPTIRRMTITPYPYLIFYEATNDEIIIHAVRHGARDPSNNPGSA